MKRLIYILFLIGLVQEIAAQKFVYDVDFLSYFDNRESKIPLYTSVTHFGLRLSPEVGIDFVDKQGCKHSLMAGVSYVQPFGMTWRNINLVPTAYYRYRNKGFQASMGSIPYRSLISLMPSLLMSDYMRYSVPNILGAQFSYQSKYGYAEAFCDWRSMPTEETREAFKIVLNGRYTHKAFFAGGYMQLNHLANKASTELKDGVCDDFVLNPYIGADVSYLTPLDSLSVKASYIGGMQRNRASGEQYIPHGFSIEFYFRWKWVGLANMFYYGNRQMPLYESLGAQFNQGEPLYNNDLYNKTSLFVSIVRKSFVNLTFYYDLHYVEGYNLSHQQRLVLNFNLEALMTKKVKDRGNYFFL